MPLTLSPALRLLAAAGLAALALTAQAAPQAGTTPAAVAAEALPAAYARWQSSMEAFAAADREQAPQAGGVLFVGSSTIRLWADLRQDFRQLPVVINRGFGGSTMADCNYFVKSLVVQYRPRHVIVYAGDNDLAEGRSPADVLESFRSFVTAVRTALPDTRISYISIKPSPLRSALLPQVREANALLAGYLQGVPQSDYIDIFTPMLTAAGEPRTDLYGPDRLHMNGAGYELWQAVITSYLGAADKGGAPLETAATGVEPAVAAAPARAAGLMQVSAGR